MLKATTNIMKKILAVSIAALFVVSMMFFALPGKVYANGAVYYVDGTLGIDDGSHGTTTGSGAFKTIQYAINDSRVTAGDTINVAAGTYNESLTTKGKALTIQGEGKDKTFLNGRITIQNDGVTIKGFTITTNYMQAISAISDKKNITIEDNKITTTVASVAGIYLQNCQNITVKGNEIYGFKKGSYSGYSHGLQGAGIYIFDDGNSYTIENNIIRNNSVGIYVACRADLSRTPSNVVAHHNNIENNEDYGVLNMKVPASGSWNYWDYGSFSPADKAVDAANNWWGDANGPSGVGPGTTGDAVSDDVNFDPWYIDESMTTLSDYVPAAPTPSAAQQAPTDYVEQTLGEGIVTVDASSVAGAYATVAGSGGQTVTIKQVPIDTALEQGFLVEGATKYVDLHLDSAQGIEKIEFTILGVSGIPKYWNGSSWIECSDYTIDAAGNVTVTITDTTIPSLSDLTGTIFTVVPAPKTVRTHEMTCWQVYVNDNNNFEFIFLWEYKNNNWISIYDSQENLVYRKSFPYGSPIVEVDLPDGTYTVKTYHEEGNILQEFTIAK